MTVMQTNLQSLLARSFGFDPAESRHHFLLNIPRGSTQPVLVSEHFTWEDGTGSSSVAAGLQVDGQMRISLARTKWDAIADGIRAEFNARLKRAGRRPGSWNVGPNLIRRELGKELVLLAWAIEDADPGLVSNGLANWRGLVPEERWWLYTQTAAASGHAVEGRGRGWRKAVRFALTENPDTARLSDEPTVPEFFRMAAERSGQGSLFESASGGKEKEDKE